jgi:hypothetical protein
MSANKSPISGRIPLVGVWTLHVLLLTAGAVWAVDRWQTLQDMRRLPELRNDPIRIGPLYDRPEIVSDEQLRAVLEKLKPRFRHAKPKINFVDHALRCWGVEAVFDDPDALSGVELRELLVDHRQFELAWGKSEPPFLSTGPAGVRVRTRDGNATASHVDHTLACLAEVGTPLDYPVRTPSGETRLRAILMQSMHDFSLNQVEYEWSALAYALYLPPNDHFFTTEGQKVSFDLLAERIMRQRLSQGVCRGNHRLHALVVLLRVNDQHRILSPDVRKQVIGYLQDVTRRFVENQHPDGFWDNAWPGSERDGAAPSADSTLTPLTSRLLVTGHVLEWWALAPTEILPADDVLIKAAQWLCRTIDDLSPNQIVANYTFLSHAGHALSLWRHRSPAECLALHRDEDTREALPRR